MDSPSRSLYLAGPTAAGKSEIALALAEKIGGEIISVDSMQVYRGLDIGTAKPGAAERKRVPHHLIDVVDLSESFDAAKFVRLAETAAAEIHARGRTPIFCGGTGLYFNAYLKGLGEAPAADPRLRAELEARPFGELLNELQERDPAAYGKIDRQNPRRVIRALEVIRLTGKKFSEQRARWEDGERPDAGEQPPQPGNSRPRIFCLARPAAEMSRRINARVDEMFRRGLVEETRGLLGRGLERNQTAMQAIGYRQVVEHLRGGPGLPETIERVKRRTRQFAKRQLTWFRRYGNCQWMQAGGGERPEDFLAEIISAR